MRLLTSVLLASMLLTNLLAVPATPVSHTAQEPGVWQTHLVQKRGQTKHRGSGRRELVSLTDVWMG